MLEERNQGGRDTHDLLRRNVDVLDVVGGYLRQVAAHACEGCALGDAALVIQRIGRRKNGGHLLVGAEILHFAGHLAALDLLIGREQEAVVVDLAEDAQRSDEADVRAFGRLDGADAAVVRNVHVAHLEAGTLAVQTARPKGRKPALMHQHRQRVGLVNHLREFAAAEEEVDGRRD